MRKLYNFSQWFTRTPDDDGKVRFVLKRGTDYHCTQSSMVNQLRIAATHCGVKVSIQDLDDSLSVVVIPEGVVCQR